MGGSALIGLLVGVLAAFAFKRHVVSRPERAREYYVLTLIIAALIYVVLAFLGGASDWAILVEACGVLVFGVFVLLSVTHDPRWLGIGWLLHPVWDLVLHAPIGPWTHAPEWYVWACLAFDIMVGVVILRSITSARNPSP